MRALSIKVQAGQLGGNHPTLGRHLPSLGGHLQDGMRGECTFEFLFFRFRSQRIANSHVSDGTCKQYTVPHTLCTRNFSLVWLKIESQTQGEANSVPINRIVYHMLSTCFRD